MSQLFISHSSADDAFVRELQSTLGDLGVSAWIDSRELRPGRLLEADIQKAIEEAAAYAVVVSPHSLQSRWVGKELRHALDVQKRRGQGEFPIIPVSLDGTKLGVLEEFFEGEPICIAISSAAGGIEEAMNTLLVALAWNRLARALSVSRDLDLWENARLFGLLNLAMADGYIASWEAKYHYKFWRPITAIRLGDMDGNPGTRGVWEWTPLQPTYPMPDHDSGHAVQGGVAAEVLKQFFSTDRIAFTACSTTVGSGRTCDDPAPVLRSYSSFSQAADENAVSRIYIGIHFRHAVEEGVRHGRNIAAYAVRRFLKPVH